MTTFLSSVLTRMKPIICWGHEHLLEAAVSQFQSEESDKSDRKWKVHQECVSYFELGMNLGVA